MSVARETNALDILLQALPTTQANSLAKQFSVTIQPPTTNTFTSLPTTTASSTSLDSTTSTLLSSTADLVTSATSVAAKSTSSPAPSSTDTGLSTGAIAGIATGAVAAVVVILLIVLYCLRVRQQGAHRRNPSQTSLLGSIHSSMKKKKKPKVFPEVAWLYDPVRPASRDRSARQSNESGPQMHANAPWEQQPATRPGTGHRSERGLTALPKPAMVELPAIPTARAIDPSFLEAGQLRRYSYPLRPAAQEEQTPVELISPLLPPMPPAAAFEQEQIPMRGNAFAQEYQQEIGRFPSVGGVRGHNASPTRDDARPLTRHGAQAF